jgi:hypothetical protein
MFFPLPFLATVSTLDAGSMCRVPRFALHADLMKGDIFLVLPLLPPFGLCFFLCPFLLPVPLLPPVPCAAFLSFTSRLFYFFYFFLVPAAQHPILPHTLHLGLSLYTPLFMTDPFACQMDLVKDRIFFGYSVVAFRSDFATSISPQIFSSLPVCSLLH